MLEDRYQDAGPLAIDEFQPRSAFERGDQQGVIRRYVLHGPMIVEVVVDEEHFPNSKSALFEYRTLASARATSRNATAARLSSWTA
jgi:hypothetical protein